MKAAIAKRNGNEQKLYSMCVHIFTPRRSGRLSICCCTSGGWTTASPTRT